MGEPRFEIPAVTGMRGIAAMTVLVFHAYYLYTLAAGWPTNVYTPGLYLGWIGVDFFFVLSGFLLGFKLLAAPGQIRSSQFWPRYLSSRWSRIAPTYYVSIAVAVVLAGGPEKAMQGSKDLILHLLYAHTFVPETFLSISPVYWTLAIEMQWYLALPLLAYALSGRAWPWITGALFALCLAWRTATYDPTTYSWLSFQAPGFLAHFALGVAAARVYRSGWRPTKRARLPAMAAATAFIAIPLALLTVPGSFAQSNTSFLANLLVRPCLAIGFALVVLLAVSHPGFLQRTLQVRPLRFLGKRSYSIYLIHMPVIIWMTQWDELAQHGLGAYLAMAAVASVAASILFHAAVERPFERLRSRLIGGSAPRHPAPSVRPSGTPIAAGRGPATPVPASQ